MQALSLFALCTLAALAFFAGIALCLLATAAFLLYRAATTQRELSLTEAKRMGEIAQQNFRAIDQLKLEVSAALTRLDAAKMHEASYLIQRTQRQFARTTDQFMKLLYSQEGAAQIAAEEAARDQEAALHEDELSSQFNPRAYSDHLRQRAAERKAEEALDQALHKPPPDPDEAWRLQEEEEEAGGPLA